MIQNNKHIERDTKFTKGQGNQKEDQSTEKNRKKREKQTKKNRINFQKENETKCLPRLKIIKNRLTINLIEKH